MFSRIWSAFGRVADAANAVADSLFNLSRSFQQADAAVRQRLELPALPAPAPELITGPMAQSEPQAPAVAEAEPAKNGRRKSMASA